MTDTSDGETQRKFVNLTKIQPNDLAKKIAETLAFMKLCYNIKQGIQNNACVDELRSCANDETFKNYLAIPKKTKIEPYLQQASVSFLFKFKNNSHSVKIKLNDELVNGLSERYIEKHLKHNRKVVKTNSINIENPKLDNSQSAELSMEEKMNRLLIQVENLTKSLAEMQEENRLLAEQEKVLAERLLKYQTTPQSMKTVKRKKTQKNNITSKKKVTETNGNDDEEMPSVYETESSDSDAHSLSSRNERVSRNVTTTKLNTEKPRVPVNKEQHAANTQRNTLTTKPPAKRERNVPPIVVLDSDQKQMNERIINRKICSSTEYHFVRVNKSKYRIQVSTLEQYDAVLNLLTELGIKYHTYTPTERKTIHVLLKRIPTCYDGDDILQYLKDDHGLSPLKLTKFTTKRMIESRVQSTIWHASFDPKTDKKLIFGINHIGNVYGIAIEQLKNKSLTQCRKCWRFEHTESNCSYDVRCYKCLASHEIGKCILDANAALKPSCVNCKNDSHSANSKECPVYQRILERKNTPGNKQTKIAKPSTKTTTVSQQNRTNVSYANIARGNQQQSRSNAQTSTNGELLNILKHLATQQMQMNELILKIAPQLMTGSKK